MPDIRLNSINVDPENAVSPDVEFKSTTESVAPRLNSVVMIRFQTIGGRAVLVSAHLPDGSAVPFGASIFDGKGSEVGLAGQDGGIYLRGIAENGELKRPAGVRAPDQQCGFSYQLPAKRKDDGPFVRIGVTCSAELATRNRHDGKPGSDGLIGQR